MKQLLLLIFLFPYYIFGIDPTLSMNVSPPTIGTNDSAEIQIIVTDGKLIAPPEVSINSDKFSITYKGSGFSQSVSIINGTRTVESIYTYSYQFLPQEAGIFTIPAFKGVDSSGKEFYSDVKKITVQAVDSLNSGRRRVQQRSPFDFFFDNEPGESFVIWNIPNTTITQNTGFIADLYLFVENPNFLKNIPQLQKVHDASFIGGYLKQIPMEELAEPVTTNLYNGFFYGIPIEQYIAFPLEEGELELSPPLFYVNNGGFGHEFSVVPISIDSQGFGGELSYIGDDLSLSVSVSTNTVLVGDELTLVIEIAGSGNADFFSDPLENVTIDNLFIAKPISELSAEILSDDVSTNINLTKTFTYTIIPQKKGTFTIPEIKLDYKSLNGELKSVRSTAIDIIGKPNKEFEKNVLEQISIRNESVQFYAVPKVILLSILLGLLIMLGGVVISKRQKKLSSDTIYARSVQADSRLKKILDESTTAFNKQQYKDSARMLRQSILSYCSDKFGLPINVSVNEVLEFLKEQDIKFEGEQLFKSLLNSLEFYAFATAPTKSQMQAHLEDAYSVLGTISKLKK